MIVFDLSCSRGHPFEGWFGSSEDFAVQLEGGRVTCPTCGSSEVGKAPMAPAVPRKGNRTAPVPKQALARGPMPPEVSEALAKLAEAQARALKDSRWVGEKFVETARAMHSGEAKAEPVHGQATLGEARDMIEDGIPVCPLPLPVIPPGQVN